MERYRWQILLPALLAVGWIWIHRKKCFKENSYSLRPIRFLVTLHSQIEVFLMHKAWLEAGTWDDLLPEHHQQEWIKWFQELNDLELVTPPRCLKDSLAKVVELSIHTFTDASESAYAAAVYMHVMCMRVVMLYNYCSIDCIKVQACAPLKAVSIPDWSSLVYSSVHD